MLPQPHIGRQLDPVRCSHTLDGLQLKAAVAVAAAAAAEDEHERCTARMCCPTICLSQAECRQLDPVHCSHALGGLGSNHSSSSSSSKE
jgi:hypothetical protein